MSELIQCVMLKAAAMHAPAHRMAAAEVLLLAYDVEREAAVAAQCDLDSDDAEGRLLAAEAITSAIVGALETERPWTLKDLQWIQDAIRD